jgi:hypothetical protein
VNKFSHLNRKILSIFVSITTALIGYFGVETSATAEENFMPLSHVAQDAFNSQQALIFEGVKVGALNSAVGIESIQLDDETKAALYSAIQNADRLDGPIINIDQNGHASVDFGKLTKILARDGATKTSA